jgi:hypothetical protein
MRRRSWRIGALPGLFGLITSIGLGVDLAAAHPGDERTDAEHAKRDLAGAPIEQIESETRANAEKIKKETGHTPGRRMEDQNVPNATLSAVAAEDPGAGGKWSSVINTPGRADLPSSAAQRQGADLGFRGPRAADADFGP